MSLFSTFLNSPFQLATWPRFTNTPEATATCSSGQFFCRYSNITSGQVAQNCYFAIWNQKKLKPAGNPIKSVSQLIISDHCQNTWDHSQSQQPKCLHIAGPQICNMMGQSLCKMVQRCHTQTKSECHFPVHPPYRQCCGSMPCCL